MASERLGMTDLYASQAEAYVVINENNRQIEAMIGGVSGIAASPPASPQPGAVYIVASAPSGDFVGKANQLAHYYNGSWRFYTPPVGHAVHNNADGNEYRWNGAAWVLKTTGSAAGKTYKNIASADWVLTDTEANCAILQLDGALTAARQVIVPAEPRVWIVDDFTSGNYPVTIKTASGSGVTLARRGRRTIVYCDGTNVNAAVTHFPWAVDGFSFEDGGDLTLGTTQGTRIGTSPSQKLGFFNADPISQPASANQQAVTQTAGGTYTTNESDMLNDLKRLVNALRADLVALGLIKGSA